MELPGLEIEPSKLSKEQLIRDVDEAALEVMGGKSRILFDFMRWPIDSFVADFTNAYDRLSGAGQLDKLDGLEQIATTGMLNGMIIPHTPDAIPGRYQREAVTLEFRRAIMKIYSINPEIAMHLLRTKVSGAHGSGSPSLITSLDHGLIPPEEVLSRGGFVFSGEGLDNFQPNASGLNDQVVCFSQPFDLQTIFRYSAYQHPADEKLIRDALWAFHEDYPRIPFDQEKLSSDNLDEVIIHRGLHQRDHLKKTLEFLEKPDKNDDEKKAEDYLRNPFPVVYFVGEDIHPGGEKGQYLIPKGDIQTEFWVKGGLPSTRITLIMVPEDKVDEIRKDVEKRGLSCKVEPIELYRSVFTN